MNFDPITSFGSATFGGAWPVMWTFAKIGALVLPLMLCVAYLTLWERKAIGWSQIRPGPNRVGPLGLLQPIADALKLIFKEIIVPTAANRGLFFLGPIMTIMPALAAWAVVPFGPDRALANINAGLLFIMAIMSMEVYGVIIAGWASNSKYAFLGAMRASAQMVSYEIAMGFALVVVLMVSASLNMTDIVLGQGRGWFAAQGSASSAGTGCRCCRSSWSTSSPASPRRTGRRSTSSKASRRSSPATWSSTRECRSRCSSLPSTPTSSSSRCSAR
jgi:NADH-quinone oxidoreductase subunit H